MIYLGQAKWDDIKIVGMCITFSTSACVATSNVSKSVTSFKDPVIPSLHITRQAQSQR